MKVFFTTLFVVLTVAAVSFGSREIIPFTSSGAGGTETTGIASESIATNPTTDAMGTRRPFVNQLFLGLDVHPTANGTITATCEQTPDGDTWFQVQDCLYSGSGAYACSQWSNTFAVVSGTARHSVLLVPANGRQTRCTFTATTATGTISVIGEGSEQ